MSDSRRVFARVMGFSLGLIFLFTLVTWLPPQVEGEAPREETVDVATLSLEEFVALGESLFNGRGACALCHQPAPAGRAPDLRGLDMVKLAAERLEDVGYQGQAKDAAGYLRESMLEPGRYVAPGWGMVGDDGVAVSPMPAVDQPPMSLTADEVNAVIAYLLAKDGNPVAVMPGKEGAL
jgi:mono/diheme cytochrome c family protein